LHAVWQTPDGKDLFAVGDAGTILHLSTGGPAADSGWVAEESPIPANLYALWGTSVDDVFAAGTYVGAGGILLHRSAGTWTQVSDLPPLGSLRAIDGLGDNNVWLAGVSTPSPTPSPVVLHWNGTRFLADGGFAAAQPPGLPRSISVAPGGDVWLCGTNGLVGHFDGANWTVQQLMNGDAAPELHRIFAVSNKEARVVGQGGFIAHLQAAKVTVETAPSAVDLLGLSAHSPAEWVAVGDYGTIVRYSGGAWAAEGSGTQAPLFAVFATQSSTVEFSVGSSSTVRSFTAPVVPCTADADCSGGYYCSGAATCERRKMPGTSCDVTDHPGASSGCAQPEGCGGCVKAAFCTDGVCCDTSPTDCAGCNACNVSGQAGTCAPVTAGADPHGACSAATGECQETTCNGAGGCGASGGTCGTPDCNAGMLTTYTCANGSCVPVTPASTCPGVLACADAHTCASKCTADTDCDAASYCDSSGNCSPRKDANAMGTCDLTKDCQVPGCRECKAGLTCVDGYCCTSSSCSPYACTNGTCTNTCTPAGGGCASDSTCYNIADGGPPDYVCYKNNGVACTDSTTCRTGICALGVCCNEACTSYCDYNTSMHYAKTTCAGGTCAPVGGGTLCPNNLGCSGEVCNTSCYTVWVGGFPMSGWPTGLNTGSCAPGYSYCNCTPAVSGGNCTGTKCCTGFPCN
jgi:hypothetical protein